MSHGGCSDCLAKRQALPTPRGKCSCRHQPFFVFIMNKTSDFWGPHVQGQWHIFLSGQRIYLLERTLFPSTWCLQYLWKCLILEPHLLLQALVQDLTQFSILSAHSLACFIPHLSFFLYMWLNPTLLPAQLWRSGILHWTLILKLSPVKKRLHYMWK